MKKNRHFFYKPGGEANLLDPKRSSYKEKIFPPPVDEQEILQTSAKSTILNFFPLLTESKLATHSTDPNMSTRNLTNEHTHISSEAAVQKISDAHSAISGYEFQENPGKSELELLSYRQIIKIVEALHEKENIQNLHAIKMESPDLENNLGLHENNCHPSQDLGAIFSHQFSGLNVEILAGAATSESSTSPENKKNRVQIKVETLEYSSEKITPSHFGTNILFHSDTTGQDSDFVQVIEDVGINFIRYPGGTIAEQFFDISNPDAKTQTNILDEISGAESVDERQVLALSEFIAYQNEIKGRSSIVLPTFRFFDQDTRKPTSDAENEVRAFIKSLLLGEYGDVKGLVLELGNEFYQTKFSWTLEEFGALQAQLAEWISNEASSLGLRGEITILAQAGRSAEENELLASYFYGSKTNEIDGVVTHLYGTNSSGNTLGIGSGVDRRLNEIEAVWGDLIGSEFELAVTEWNVGEDGPENTKINGLMRLAPLMRIFGEMLENGVDIGMIWSTQTYGPAGLSSKEGAGSELSPTGYLYSMLIESTMDMRLLAKASGPQLENESGETVGYSYTFTDDENYVSYFVSGIGSRVSLSVDLSMIHSDGAYVYAAVLGKAPGTEGTEYHAEASVRYLTALELTDNEFGEPILTYDLDPYELIELHIVFGQGVSLTGDAQNEISDNLVGSNFSDILSGEIGNDKILGESGDDSIFGGSGDDHLEGGNDHDSITGGPGDDTLLGEHGKDYLDGGVGNDYLSGGRWHDTLVAGGGQDTLDAGDGNDLLKMSDGTSIAAGGNGFDTLDFSDLQRGVNVWALHNKVEVGQEMVDYSEVEKIVGSPNSDRFGISGSDMVYFGGDGADMFEFSYGLNNEVDGGGGNDWFYVYEQSGSEIRGGSGEDCFFVKAGENTLAGGSGDDCFYLFSSNQNILEFHEGDGDDTVLGFEIGQDLIVLEGFSSDEFTVTHGDKGTLIKLSSADSIFLQDTSQFSVEDDIIIL